MDKPGLLAVAIFTAMVGFFGCLAATVQAQAVEPTAGADEPAVIGARAHRILREMGAYLQTAREFSFRADVSYDTVLDDGQKLQYGGVARVAVRRTNQLVAKFDGDERQTRVFYDGKKFTIHNAKTNVYTVTKIADTLDNVVDHIFEKYGFSVPIADFVYADPYQVLIENAQRGHFVGLHTVDGTPCHHLAFVQDEIDWQIWIAAGPRPVPRKLVITYKNEPGSPHYAARLSKWDFEPRLAEQFAVFHPPAASDEIEFLPPELAELVEPVEAEAPEEASE